MIGKPIAVAVNDMVEIAKLETEKFRSLNSPERHQGLAVVAACH